MPYAARVDDATVCALVTGGVPHVGGPILPPGEPTVLIEFMPAARQDDLIQCVGATDAIAKGSATVLIGGKPAARLYDVTKHVGVVVLSAVTVRIGDSPQGASFMGSGAPLVEQCEKPGAPLSV